ncbi:MAG: primosomal protein N' [Clostridia bacterium]|nr:primosomal protein N' [Clostridia bacterium]
MTKEVGFVSDYKYANIIVDISHEKLDRTFQYLIPQDLKEKLHPGTVVEIPFGKGNHLIKGYILELTGQAEFPEEKMKYVASVLTDNSLVETRLIQLAWWMKQNYGSTMITALKTVLPIKKQVKAKESKSIRLLLTTQEAISLLEVFEKKNQTARYRLLSALIEQSELPYELVRQKLNISTATIRSMEEADVLKTDSTQIYRNPVKYDGERIEKKQLNEEQQSVVDLIKQDLTANRNQVYLLHGITGSGKTELYIDLIEDVIKKGKQAIVLIPEIALTFQTVMRFYQRFGERVSTLHSRLSEGEKYDQFDRAKKGEIDVMIGPRSALFTPFESLGMIVIDEEHEASYKSETMPRYHARETAIALADMCGASVILGSATPSIESYYRAKTGEFKLFELTKRAVNAKLPEVHIVDMRAELKSGNRSVLSTKLRELIEERLNKKEQIMLFLNRRGYAGFVSCRACGHVMKCPHCDISLSSHKNHKLICHYCGYEETETGKCPECGSTFIGGMKAGTQQIEQLIQKEFPNARVLRMDMDTTKEKNGHEKILSRFANREADILVGTQMIVKGHDFPYVTLVGILAADLSLHVNDYRAAERTFQLLTQAAGRAGRDKRPGEVIIQTYVPDHYSIISAADQDYVGFYEKEISYRKLMHYPPSGHMLAVMTEGMNELLVKEYSQDLSDLIRINPKQMKKNENYDIICDKALSKAIVIGPADASVRKVNDVYRRMIYIKADEYGVLTQMKDMMEAWINQRDDKRIRVQFDFNPMSSY